MDVVNILGVVSVLGAVFISAFYRFSAFRWTMFIGIVLFAFTLFDFLPTLFSQISWVIYLIAAAFANLHILRQRYLVKFLLPFLKKQLPPISATEREAIEAGNTWWEKQLFSGSPHWQELFAIEKPTLTTEEQHFLNHQVDQLCAKIDDWQIIFAERDLPEDVWAYLKKEKFFGMVIPKNYGGLGFSALAHSTVVTKIATRSISAAVNTMVPNSLGPAELILHYGTEEQKNYYLPRLASGEDIPCFALTAPDAGSDAGSIPDSGVVCKGMHNGKETLGIRLNWDKRYITLAPVATVLGLAFRLYDPDHLLGKETDIGITLCLIPASHPGVEIGNRHYPLLLAFMNGPTRGKDVFIPIDWIIGGSQMAGNGWRMLMECLSIGRAISLPALATACSKVIYRNTGAYSRLRRQFNSPLSSFEGIEEALGYIAGYTYLLEASRIMTAGAVDLKIRPSTASAIAKYHMTELSRQVISHAMDVHAGHTIQVGPRNFLANLYFAIPISITVEGANILTRNLIIFGQGAIRCHPYLLKEIELISAATTNLSELDKTLMGHIGFYTSNLLRNIAYGLTGGKFIFTTVKNKRIRKYQRQLTRMSAALALLADTSLILLGGSLKRRERISARLGDIMSQLYLASAVLKFYHDHHQPASDVDYVCWSLQECLRKIQTACNELTHNFPHAWIGKLLRFIVFPFGQAYAAPSDKLHKKIVTSMLEPSALRDRLTQYCFTSQESSDIGNRLNQVLTQMDSVDPLWKKIQQAVKTGAIPANKFDTAERIRTAQIAGIVTQEEVDKLKAFDVLRNEIIKVNEFSFDLAEIIA
jgi:acyl-CoA dehydrogenase